MILFVSYDKLQWNNGDENIASTINNVVLSDNVGIKHSEVELFLVQLHGKEELAFLIL